MAEQDYAAVEQKFDVKGLDLNSPTDAQRSAGRYPLLVNVRRIVDGAIKQRPGFNKKVTGIANKTPWHSIRRLNSKESGASVLIHGIQDILATDNTGTVAAAINGATATQIDSGYSGNPLSLIPFRPEFTRKEWMAVADDNKMVKVDTNGTVRSLGLAAPTEPPYADVKPGPKPHVVLESFNGDQLFVNGQPLYPWTFKVNGITAGAALLNPTFTDRVITTIPHVRRTTPLKSISIPTFGAWYTCEAAAMANLGPGMRLDTQTSLGTFTVAEVFAASQQIAGGVSQVFYEPGGTLCTVSLKTNLQEARRHALVQFSYGASASWYPILEVLVGPDGQQALVVDVGATVISAGMDIQIRGSFYGHFIRSGGTGDPIEGEIINGRSAEWTARTGGTTYEAILNLTGAPRNGLLYDSGIKAVDLVNDLMHVSVYAASPTTGVTAMDRIVEIRIEADVDDGTFAKNWYSRTIRPDDLTPLIADRQTSVDTRIAQIRKDRADAEDARAEKAAKERSGGGDFRRGRGDDDVTRRDEFNSQPLPIDPPGWSSSQAGAGNAQWSEIMFRLVDFERHGTDTSKTLQAINGLRIKWTTKAATDVITVAVDDWYITGGGDPDVDNNAPYEYQYRYRDSSTGTRSNWSPTSRAGVTPHRYNVVVNVTGTAVVGVDKIDVRRRGGSVSDWRILGSLTNTGATYLSFADGYSDNYASGLGQSAAALEGNVNSQPFPIRQAPAASSGGVLAGTMLLENGAFNTNWLQGTEILVNGIPTLIYRVHSANLLEVYDVCGTGNVSWEIAAPFITSPLPVIFELGKGLYGGCGDPKNPGRLYLFNKWTLDSTKSTSWVDVTDNDDPLMNGCSFGNRGYLWSSKRMFVVSEDPSTLVRADEVAAYGLYAKWALAVGDLMYFLSKDGIYSSDGSSTVCVSRRDLAPLFPTFDRQGLNTDNGVGSEIEDVTLPIAGLTAAQQATYRLCFAGTQLFFLYSNTSTLVLDSGVDTPGDWGWFYDTINASIGAAVYYSDEGEGRRNVLIGGRNSTANLYNLGGSRRRDDGVAFNCAVRTFATDGGDGRTAKLLGDIYTDLDPNNASITPTVYFDNFSTSVVGTAVSGSGGRTGPRIIDLTGGGRHARNVAIDLRWSVTNDTVNPTLYRWGFSVMGRPPLTIDRATDYSDLGHWGPKELRALDIECDTLGASKPILVEYTKEDGTVGTVSFTVNAAQKTILPLAVVPPVVGYEFRLRPTDPAQWRYFQVVNWDFEPLTDRTGQVRDWTRFDEVQWVQAVEIEGDTNNVTIAVPVQRDFSEVIRTIPSVTHNGLGKIAYAFNPPFLAYMVRLAPSGAFRVMNSRWITKPESPLTDTWETQEWEMGDPYGWSRRFEVEYASAGSVTLSYYVDGVLVLTDLTNLIPTGSSEIFKRVSIDLPAVKGRLGKLKLTGVGVRVRRNGSTVYGGTWGGDAKSTPVIGAAHGQGAEA